MKHILLSTSKQVLSDRPLAILCISIILLSVLYVIYVSFSISPTELQIATRYSAFGETQYYRNKWFYLLTFIGFGIATSIMHVAIIAKLKSRDMRPLAIAFGALAILLGIICFLWTYSVLNIAYLN
jgi:uncharacterized membrane protein HdeD (DUF308 family)